MRIQFHGLSNYHAEDHRDLSRTVVPGHINSNITDMSGIKNKPIIQRGWIDLPIAKTPHPAARTMLNAPWIKPSRACAPTRSTGRPIGDGRPGSAGQQGLRLRTHTQAQSSPPWTNRNKLRPLTWVQSCNGQVVHGPAAEAT